MQAENNINELNKGILDLKEEVLGYESLATKFNELKKYKENFI